MGISDIIGIIQIVVGGAALFVAVVGLFGLIQQMKISNRQRFFELKLNLISLLNESHANSKKAIAEIVYLRSDIESYISKNKDNTKIVEQLRKVDSPLLDVEDKLKKIDEILKGLSGKLKAVNSSVGMSVLEDLIEKTLGVNSEITKLSNFPYKLRADLKYKKIIFPST